MLALEAKLEQLTGVFTPEVDRLVRELRSGGGDGGLGEPTAGGDGGLGEPTGGRDGLVRALASLPVYRTYVQAEQGHVSELDVRYINEAIDAAKANRPEVDPELPFSGFYSMRDLLNDRLQMQHIEVTLLGILAGLALLLSSIGIYALVSHLVVQRRREIGIRFALGCTLGRAIVQAGLAGAVAVGAGGDHD